MSAQDRYIQTIERKLGLAGYHAAWPTGLDAGLGDFGRFSGDAFVVDGHLSDHESFEIDPPDVRPDGLTYGAEQGLDISVTGDWSGRVPGTSLLDAALGVKIGFRRADQVIVRAAGVEHHRVRDRRAFAERVINAYWNRKVAEGDCFVIALMTAASGAAAVAGDAGATIDLTGRGDIAAGVAPGLGTLQAGIGVASASKISLEVSMGNGFVLAFRLVELDHKGLFIREPVVEDKRSLDGVDAPAVEYLVTFDEVDAPA